jgi:hypothetical protein
MSIRWIIALVWLLGSVPCFAQTPASVEIEVNFLLGFIKGSRCEFYRNGTWHDSQEAQIHLRNKYNYLEVRNLINTAEDFIDRVATASSLTGTPYEVRCNSAATVNCKQWLQDELARFRSF